MKHIFQISSKRESPPEGNHKRQEIGTGGASVFWLGVPSPGWVPPVPWKGTGTRDWGTARTWD